MRPTFLKLARIKANIRQNELAASVGVGVTMLSRYENGNAIPSLKTLWKISRVLGVSLDELAQDLETQQVAQ